jgi:hypothetical protein
VNVDELVAIDIHTHAEVSTRMVPDEAAKELDEAKGRYFKYVPQHPTIAQMAAYYRARKMGFVVFASPTRRSPRAPRSTPTSRSRSRASTRHAASWACGRPGGSSSTSA